MTNESEKRLKFLMYLQTAMLTVIMSILGYIVVRVDNISSQTATNTATTEMHSIRLTTLESKINMIELYVERLKTTHEKQK